MAHTCFMARGLQPRHVHHQAVAADAGGPSHPPPPLQSTKESEDYRKAIHYYEPFVAAQRGSLLAVKPSILANLCACPQRAASRQLAMTYRRWATHRPRGGGSTRAGA